MKFDDRYFKHLNFSKEQIDKNLKNAFKDFGIAKKDNILEVKFNYTYTPLIKAGIALLSFYKLKIKSVPGHHIKIIEKMSDILKNDTIDEVGNAMRSKRNLDFYSGGIEVTEKECREYINFVENVLGDIQKHIKKLQAESETINRIEGAAATEEDEKYLRNLREGAMKHREEIIKEEEANGK